MLKVPFKESVISYRDSEFPLNDDWTLLCGWHRDEDLYLIVDIKFNKNMTSEEILISGDLKVSYGEFILDNTDFAKFVKSSKPRNLTRLKVFQKAPKHPISEDYRVVGEIIFVSQCVCACIFQSTDNEKCVQPKSLVQLSNDIEKLLNPQTPTSADVVLICGSVSIPAHKIILSARSPVFASMFQNPMQESSKNQVNIDDIEANIFKIVIMYIYSGKTTKLTVDSASDLLLAADKYQLQDLKEVCVDFLKKNINHENVLMIIDLSDLLAKDLKSFAVEYLCKRCMVFSSFEKTEEWIKLRDKKPDLALDIAASIMKYREGR